MEKENELGAILANSEENKTCKCGNEKDNCKCMEISEAELRRNSTFCSVQEASSWRAQPTPHASCAQ